MPSATSAAAEIIRVPTAASSTRGDPVGDEPGSNIGVISV